MSTDPYDLIPRAVALGYDKDTDAAPRVLAAGQGEIAREIIRLAEAGGVTTVENAPVAKALVRLNPGQEIPVELYRAVAEILAYVYQMKGRV